MNLFIKQNVHKRNYDEKAITSCNHLYNDFEKLTGKSFEKCEDSNEAYYWNIYFTLR